ncbi:TetR/AcrR family transcriptional regulator [Yinghuangia sp. ASG 101]|uniref:TetR/AcrR family transcriptional regulator n=1 Tax=Yinghuangia sp. ASG 101 TaxID=2896848 RepID=UPI001E2EB9F6|nr:TetR/AcrR family transcriptional regulator [Yinghuangia sp. ASG 101]UGQ13238.1 TetR/AcrR family transcriptional regulator [Yinghuangia sp. ASG 101]
MGSPADTDDSGGPGGVAEPVRAGRPRRGGRPTLAQAEQLSRRVREHALELFLEHGYDGTSMDAIAAAAGTTKASLYARFPSKDAVFVSVLKWAVGRPDWPVPEPPAPDLDDLEGALTAIAHMAANRALHPSMVKLSRVAAAHAERFPDVARRTSGFSRRHELLVELLARHTAAGRIVADDPEVLAEHFLGMVAGVPARLASFGTVRSQADHEHHIAVAVRLFMRGLRPD